MFLQDIHNKLKLGTCFKGTLTFSFCCLLLTTYQIPTILRMTAIFLFCLQQIDQNKTKPQGDSL